MQEAGRHPNQAVEVDFGNLGSRDIDLAYDWIEHSPEQAHIDAATKWLMNTINQMMMHKIFQKLITRS